MCAFGFFFFPFWIVCKHWSASLWAVCRVDNLLWKVLIGSANSGHGSFNLWRADLGRAWVLYKEGLNRLPWYRWYRSPSLTHSRRTQLRHALPPHFTRHCFYLSQTQLQKDYVTYVDHVYFLVIYITKWKIKEHFFIFLKVLVHFCIEV